MEEYEYMSPLSKLLFALKEHEMEYIEWIADDVSTSLIVIDADGNPHECWNGGSPDHVNVVVAMTIDDALTFFSHPLRVFDAERNADLLSKNAKLRELCADLLKGFDCGWPSDVCGDCERDGEGMPIGGCKLENRARELGVEVPNGERLNVPIPPDDDFPQVICAQKYGEDFKKEFVEYVSRWNVDKRRQAECVVDAHDLAAANERRCKALGRELRQLRAVSHEMRVMLEGMASRCDVCPRHWCQGEGELPGTCALDGDLERCGVTLPPSMPRGFVSQCREEDE